MFMIEMIMIMIMYKKFWLGCLSSKVLNYSRLSYTVKIYITAKCSCNVAPETSKFVYIAVLRRVMMSVLVSENWYKGFVICVKEFVYIS
jgi:hypothetical protein